MLSVCDSGVIFTVAARAGSHCLRLTWLALAKATVSVIIFKVRIFILPKIVYHREYAMSIIYININIFDKKAGAMLPPCVGMLTSNCFWQNYSFNKSLILTKESLLKHLSKSSIVSIPPLLKIMYVSPIMISAKKG